jgi:hypothetical protein
LHVGKQRRLEEATAPVDRGTLAARDDPRAPGLGVLDQRLELGTWFGCAMGRAWSCRLIGSPMTYARTSGSAISTNAS